MTKVVDMQIGSATEDSIKYLGKLFGTKARSKVMNEIIHIISNEISDEEITYWFKEGVPDHITRHTTIRIDADAIQYASKLSATLGVSRPSVLRGLVSLGVSHMRNKETKNI